MRPTNDPIRTALEHLHDLVSDIVEDGLLDVGDDSDCLSNERYADLIAALGESNLALESEPREGEV